jgi:fucose permease
MNEKKSSVVLALVPVMLCFFAMGFVDLVGTATNFVKSDFQLSDSIANLLPSMVFVMFLLFSVPSGLLMNKIGRKQTVLISLVITLVALLIPCFIYSYWTMLASFILLGIGNAVLQTSLNPLVSNVIRSDKLASSMTFGQFVKAIASFLAPVIAAWGVSHPVFGLSWRILFPIYTIVGVIATLWAFCNAYRGGECRGTRFQFQGVLLSARKPFILLCFIGIICHVGIDVGINVTAPKVMVERLGVTLSVALQATMVYFICRTIGSFLGTFILQLVRVRTFFAISLALIGVALIGLMVFSTEALLLVCIGIIGFGNSNIFSMIFSEALLDEPDKKKRGFRTSHHGTYRRNGFPVCHGICK